MSIIAKRTVMTLYSDPQDPYSHQVRIVLAEKGVNVEIHNVNPDEQPEALLELNPYGTAPTLLDRELIVYQANIIMEYIDERFPHPPLLPVYPVARAECRKMLFRIENDWYSLYHTIMNARNEGEVSQAQQYLQESLLSVTPIFADKPFFLNEEFTLIDCAIAPLLWRLPQLGIHLPKKQASAIYEYAERMFSRPAFQASLTELEREQRAA